MIETESNKCRTYTAKTPPQDKWLRFNLSKPQESDNFSILIERFQTVGTRFRLQQDDQLVIVILD